MFSSETNSFDADNEHQPIVIPVSTIPINPANKEHVINIQLNQTWRKKLPWSDMSTLTPESPTMGSRQYPRTETTAPKVVPSTVINVRRAYMAMHPSTPMP